MKKITLISTLIFFVLATPALAKTEMYHHTSGSTPPAHVFKHHVTQQIIHGTVTATAKDSITVSVKKTTATFTVTDQTTIEQSGDFVNLTDIKKGDRVMLQAKGTVAEMVEVEGESK